MWKNAFDNSYKQLTFQLHDIVMITSALLYVPFYSHSPVRPFWDSVCGTCFSRSRYRQCWVRRLRVWRGLVRWALTETAATLRATSLGTGPLSSRLAQQIQSVEFSIQNTIIIIALREWWHTLALVTHKVLIIGVHSNTKWGWYDRNIEEVGSI